MQKTDKSWKVFTTTSKTVMLLAALIYPALLVVVALVGHYWFHWPDAVVAFLILLIVGEHELDKITDKLDAITESVESLEEDLEIDEMRKESPQPNAQSQGSNTCPTCHGLTCVVCSKPCSGDYADCPTCGRHWKEDALCGERWTEVARRSATEGRVQSGHAAVAELKDVYDVPGLDGGWLGKEFVNDSDSKGRDGFHYKIVSKRN